MNDPLRKYVEEQARNHVDPRYIRYNLIKAGWSERPVDEAIAKVFTHPGKPTTSGSKPLLLYLVVVVAILVGVILFIYNVYQDDLFKPPERPDPDPRPTPDPEPVEPTPVEPEPVDTPDPVEVRQRPPQEPAVVDWTMENPCTEISRSVDKDACYTKIIKENEFDCDDLTDAIERNFCFRALDAYMFPIDWEEN